MSTEDGKGKLDGNDTEKLQYQVVNESKMT